MENETKPGEFKPGAVVGDFIDFNTDQSDAFQRAAIVALEALQLCVAFAVNNKDTESLTIIKTICSQILKDAGVVLKSGGVYNLEPPK